MCSPRKPTSDSKLPPLRDKPQVCTLHVPDILIKQQQYTPIKPCAEAYLGPRGARVSSKSRSIFSLYVQPKLPASTFMILQPTSDSPLGNNLIIQAVRKDGRLSILANNWEK